MSGCPLFLEGVPLPNMKTKQARASIPTLKFGLTLDIQGKNRVR